MSGPRSEPPQLPGYRHLGYLGGGGFADVFLYEQERPNRQVAIKVLRSTGLGDQAQQAFDAEGDLMAKVSAHPYIVQIFNADVAPDGRPYFVMEYYPGRHLGERLKERQFPVDEVLQLGVRLSSAIATAHQAGILHRDIKPANVLMSQYGHPGLTDFGIAGASGPDGKSASEGVSVPYAPPEVITDRSPGDERSDVYSLAATLYALLAGRSPFEILGGDNTVAALAQRVIGSPVPPIGRDDVPMSLELLLSQAMAKEPSQRPASVTELGHSLQGIERQLGHAPTEFQVAAAPSAAPLKAPPIDDDDGTRAAKIQVVHQPESPAADATQARPTVPQPSPVVSPPPMAGPSAAASAAPSGRERMPVPEAPVESDTVARTAVPLADSEPQPAAVAVAPTSRRSLWIAIGAGVAVLAVVVGVIVAASGSKGSGSATSTTEVVDDQGLVITETPLAPTAVTITSDGSTATVTWSPGANGEPGDTYTIYRTDIEADSIDAPTSPHAFPIGPGEAPCVQMSTERGSRTSIEKSAVVCA